MVNIPWDNDNNKVISFVGGNTEKYWVFLNRILNYSEAVKNTQISANDNNPMVSIDKITRLWIEALNGEGEISKAELLWIFDDLLFYGLQKYSKELRIIPGQRYDTITAACYLDNALWFLEEKWDTEVAEFKILQIWKQVLAEVIGAPDYENISFEKMWRVISNVFWTKKRAQ